MGGGGPAWEGNWGAGGPDFDGGGTTPLEEAGAGVVPEKKKYCT